MRYTPDQLEGLRQSPLVKKPDGLPSILQWMEVSADQGSNHNSSNGHTANNGTARRTRGTRDGEGATTEHRTDRPLINPMGQFGRRQSMQPGEETVLGPPKLNFTSAARAAKNSGDKQERTGIVSADGDQLGDRFPRDKTERWSRDGDRDRNRERGITNGRRGAGAREDGEGWTSVKGRKSLGQEDFERFARNGDRGDRGDRNRDKLEGALEDDAPPRRGQRDRTERTERWGRRDETKEEGSKFAVQGGWRERAQQQQQQPQSQRDHRERGDRDRDWDRGGNRGDEDPEWMDTKVEKKKEPQMKTQADFERWKEQMKAKDAPAEERGAPNESSSAAPAAATATATATGIAAGPMFTAPVHTPGPAEPTQGILFGNWGNVKGAELGQDESIKVKAKPAKASKFMSMFAKPEEPAAPSPMPAPALASPAPHANEDQQGFQRILQMLGQVNVSSPQPAPPNQPSPPNGVRGHGGGISLDFQQSPPPDLQNQRPPPHRTLEQQSILQNILAPRPAQTPDSRPPQQPRFNAMSPDNAPQDHFAPPRPDSGRQEGQSPFQQPPSRNANPQDANLAAILNSRAREDSQRDNGQKQREREFLLTLMQQPRNTPPQMMNPNLPRGGPPMAMFENMQHEQRAPPQQKPRGGLPPGFMEDPRMFNENEMARQEAQRREQELRHMQQQQQQQQQKQQQDLRNQNPRLPMGFPGHEDPALSLQRRNTAGEIPRQMTNMGIPSQQHPDLPFMGGRGQPGMPPTPQDRPNIAPPPGFGGPMRQPPGFAPQQQMGPGGPSFSAGNTPLGGHPPGLPQLGGGSMRGMPPGFPGVPGGNGMQGPPAGYFPPPPPQYGMPPGMRADDPRVLFDGQFGGPPRGPPPQQHGRPGPPPNLY
ncbi:hypothetical protein B5807_11164 [Epicoccum nigrum]|uniref:Uncharacterized protein n=1 Tax=Epicoccum nigrum TaxID=105696 RepID=A0A1Y2LL11_EPING|nr:hypothetical protein B5807_11164 [Epicoccum nigrum]